MSRLPEFLGDLAAQSAQIVGFTSAEKIATLHGQVFRATIALRGGGKIGIPGVKSIHLVVGDQTAGWMLIPIEFLVKEPKLSVPGVPLKLEIDSVLLQPAKKVTGAPGDPVTIVPDESAGPLRIGLGALSASINAEGEFDFDFDAEIDLPLCTIGKSGLGLEAHGVRFYGRSNAPPKGQPVGWRGMYLREATIYLPTFLAKVVPTLVATDCYMGNGGFTGAVAGVWTPHLQGDKFVGAGAGEIFGVPFALDKLGIKLCQNTFEESTIKGRLILPFFDEVVHVDISFDAEGSVHVGLDSPNSLKTFTKTGLLEMTLDSIRFDLDGGVFTATLAGTIKPLVGADKGLRWPTFDVQALSINSKGEVSITGGWIELPKAYTLNLALFKLEITKFGMGRTDKGEKYLGFSGGLDLIKGIPAGASVEGLRIIWGETGDPRLTLEGVGVEFSIPGTLDFKGAVSYREPTPTLRAFTGDLTLNLPKLKLQLDAKVVFGSDVDSSGKRFKYFALYVEGEFGTGIPLFNTGLSITGIAALFSVNYAPDKPAEWMWYSMDQATSWFHKPAKGVTDIVHKWAPENRALGLGAGVMLESNGDSGYLFHGKFLLLFLFPGPVVMIEGRCDFLKRPGTKDDGEEPTFHALLVLDFKAGYFLIGLDAKWKHDADTGKLAEIAGSAEAYFNFLDPRQWRIWVGKKPLEQRIRATFAGVFNANAYFMLDPKSLALGVWIGRQEHYQFGPVSADLEAWLDANAELSFRPTHLTAGIWVHGLFAVKVFKFRLGIGVDARLDADVSKPFHIVGTLTLTVQTKLKDFELEVRLEWGPQPERPEIPEPFKDAGIAHLKSTADWPMRPAVPVPIVPVDGRPYLTFELPVHDTTGVTLNPSPDPGWLTVGDPATGQGTARVRYELQTVAIEKGTGNGWIPVPGLYGSWAAGSAQCRLMLYAKTPFEITDNGATWNPWVADNLPDYPCPVVRDVRACIDMEKADARTLVTSPWRDAAHPEIEARWNDGRHRVFQTPQPISGQHQGILFTPAKTAAAFVLNTVAGTISVIDTATDQISGAPIAVGGQPYRAALTLDGARAVLVNRDSQLVVVDVASRAVDGPPIPVTSPVAVAIHPDGVRAYLTSDRSKSIAVVDLVARTVLREIPVSAISAGIAILPNGERVYVSHPGAGTISVIDTISDTLAVTVPSSPAGLTRMPYLVSSIDGAILFVSGGADVVAVLDTRTNRFGTPIQVDRTPSGMVLTPDGERLYVANTDSDSVSVIDVASRRVMATIATGPQPFGIAVTPDGTKVYVADQKSDDVTVIDVASNRAAARIAVGARPNDIVIPPHVMVSASVGVEIEVPAGSAIVEVVAYQPGRGQLVGTVVDPRGFEKDEEIPNGSILRLAADTLKIRDGIRRVLVTCDGEWVLMRVCYVRPDLAGGLAELNHLHDQLQQGVSVWGKPAAVLEPFTDYQLRATVERTTAGQGALSGWNESALFDRTWPFTTGGPPGLVALPPPANVPADKSAIGLDDLTRYVEQTIPPTLTPKGARPELTRPVYRAYDVGVSFNEDYVDRMYELAERDLAIQIYDSSDRSVRNVEGRLAVMANAWGNAAEVQLTETRTLWIEVLNAASCLPEQIAIGALPRNKTLAAADHVFDAKTLLEARLVPLLLRAAIPGVNADWTMDVLLPGVPMLKRTGGKPVAAADWTDVLVRVEIQPAATGRSGVAFRHGAQGCYVLAVDVSLGQASLIRLAGGVATRLADRPFAYDANQSYRFSIEAIGSRLRLEQDGALLFSADDATHPKGTIALFPWMTGGPPRLFDVAVHDFSKGAPAAYRFPFTTSEYVDFVHQVHAHQDMTWPGTLPATVDLAVVAVRAADPSAPVSEDEARAYGAVADALLGAAARQLAARLEVTRVDQANGLTALLIRGDEPFDWRRTTLTVRQAGDVANPLLSPERMKVAGAAFGGTPVGADDVEVLLREPLDPTGCRIEARLAPRPLREASEPALLTDRFAEDDLTGWTLADELPTGSTPPSSTWQTARGWLRLANTSPAGGDPAFLGTLAAAGDPTWSDVALTARVRCLLGGAVGMVFRGRSLDDYYRFSMNSRRGYRQLVKKVAGVFTVLWRDHVAYDPEAEYELTFVAVGSSLRGFVDGVPLFAVDDATHASGAIACYVSGNEASFSEVRVDRVGRVAAEWLLDERFAADPSDRWTFDPAQQWSVVNRALVAPPSTASAVAGESTWSDYRLSVLFHAGPTGATEVVFRRQAPDRYYAVRFDADAAEVRLLKVAGAVETTFWQQAWSPGTMLATVDCLGSTIVCYLNAGAGARVTDADLSAGRVGINVRGATGSTIAEVRVAPTAWTLWYEFANERLRAAGTRFVVHGSELDVRHPPVPPGTIRKLVAPRAHTPRLPLAGVDLRLVDAGGHVEHARHFLPDTAFIPIDVDLMRNADGTGFFLLPKPASTFKPGTYRLALQYERNKPGVSPILSRAGSQAPEWVHLDIAVTS